MGGRTSRTAIDSAFALEPDRRPSPMSRTAALIAKYGGRVPRYTSYPTAAQFTPAVAEAEHRAWLAALDARSPVSLYLHVPFCDRLCWYCGCHTAVVHQRGPVADYVRTLVREIEITGRALPESAQASALHFGGGTPNIIAPDDLRALVGALRERFTFTAPFEFAVELDPRILTSEWVDAAADLGLNRASLGVQDLNAQVQRAINRLQPYAQIEWAATRLRQAGVGSINLDLMYGLPHQSVATVVATLDQVLALSPERIALFGYAHVPWMKAHQKLLPEASLPDAVERFDQQSAAAERLDKAGYVRIGLDHFAKHDDELAKAERSGLLRRNFQGYTSDHATSLLGFGASSISAMPQGYVQNAARVPEWRQRVNAGRLAAARGLVVGSDDRVRGEIIERLMCDMRVDVAGVCAAHNRSPSQFAAELLRLAEMEADGLVEREGAHIEVTKSGRPFVRTIAAVFDAQSVSGAGRHAPSI
ncbi:MAG: oxygen-independent coproporphyrinogen III oxidase [Roseiarcus sp.]|jgi:oxygen-independent coproporphyrinogen III oxidase